MLQLAFRNVLRNRRRSYLTFFLVISGTFLLSGMRFVAYGFTQEMITRAVRLDSGLVEVAAYGWLERPTLYRALATDKEFLESLKSASGGSIISPRIKSGALLNSEDRTRFVSVLAADSEVEEKITTLHKTLLKGSWPKEVDTSEVPGKLTVYEAAIGEKLAKALRITTDAQIYLISSQFDGSMGAIPLRITGIYRTGLTPLDSSRVVISLDAGHRLFGTKTDEKTYYSSVAIEAADFMEADKKEEILKKLFPKPVDPDGLSASESSIFDPVVLGWKELNPSVIEMTAMAAMKMDFYLVFLIITISFGILNTVQMSIQERMREFGILIAIGTGIGRLTLMILYEVIILIVPPVLTGLIFASAFAMYFNTYPLDFSGTVLGKMYISMGLNPILRPIIDFYDLLKIALWMILPSLAVGLFAAGRIRKLNPVQVIQTL